jgi:hypothetical protein
MQTYCIFQLIAVAFTFSTTGAMAQTFAEVDPYILNKWGQSFQLMRVGMTVILGWSVLMQYQNAAVYNGLVRALVLSCALTLGLLWTGSTQLALELSFALLVINPLVQLFGVVKAQGIEHRIQKILVIGYAFYALILVYGSAVAFGWLPGRESDATLSTISDWRLNGGLISLFVFWIVIRQHQSGKLKQLEEVQALRLVRLQSDNQAQQLKERIGSAIPLRAKPGKFNHRASTLCGEGLYRVGLTAPVWTGNDNYWHRCRRIVTTIEGELHRFFDCREPHKVIWCVGRHLEDCDSVERHREVVVGFHQQSFAIDGLLFTRRLHQYTLQFLELQSGAILRDRFNRRIERHVCIRRLSPRVPQEMEPLGLCRESNLNRLDRGKIQHRAVKLR